MKTLRTVTWAIGALLCLGISPPAVNAEPSPKCIDQSPNLGDFLSLISDKSVGEMSAHFVVYVERSDGSKSKAVILCNTTNGRLLVHVVDIPTGFGWFGPF